MSLISPHWRETQSHRGWEIREPHYTVFANTSLDDARWAAGHVKQAWTNAERLTDRWTDLHRQPGFGQAGTQIVIDSEPRRERDGPPVTVDVVGIQTQVYLNVAAGQPGLKLQALRLREAAALAMLHTAGLDSAVSPWVMQGLAANVAEEGLDADTVKAARDVNLAARIGGQQWRYTRSAQDVLDYPALDGESAATSIKFLLEGDDAAMLRRYSRQFQRRGKTLSGMRSRAHSFAVSLASLPAPERDTPIDKLIAELRPQFEAWQSDPLAGQPLFKPEPGLAPDMLAAQREMLVLLKLHHKLAARPPGGGPQPRVTTFDRELGREIATSPRPAAAASFAEFVQRLNDRCAPVVATLDADGRLLLSSDTERIAELVGQAHERYALASDGRRTVFVRHMASGAILQGWLHDSPDQPARLWRSLKSISARPRSATYSRPAQQTGSRPRN